MKTGTIIRKVELSDIDDIIEIENLSFCFDKFSIKQFSYLISKSKGFFFGLDTNGKIIAYISLLTRLNTNNLRIYSLAVHPKFRGMDFAGILIEKSIEYAKEINKKYISLEVRPDNLSAINLYEKKGFVKTEIKKGYYNDGSESIFMKLNVL